MCDCSERHGCSKLCDSLDLPGDALSAALHHRYYTGTTPCTTPCTTHSSKGTGPVILGFGAHPHPPSLISIKHRPVCLSPTRLTLSPTLPHNGPQSPSHSCDFMSDLTKFPDPAPNCAEWPCFDHPPLLLRLTELINTASAMDTRADADVGETPEGPWAGLGWAGLQSERSTSLCWMRGSHNRLGGKDPCQGRTPDGRWGTVITTHPGMTCTQ